MYPLFPLGRIGLSLLAERAFRTAGQNPNDFLHRHVTGDWDAHNRPFNQQALTEGGIVLSEYVLGTGIRIVIGTTADRSETGVLLRSEVDE